LRIEYNFLERGKIELQGGDWAHLSFQRNKFRVYISKPIFKPSFYIRIARSNGPVQFDISRLEPGGALGLPVTMVSIELDLALEIPEEKVDETFQPTALEIFRDFNSWVRVRTRQHWIGYQDSLSPEQHFNVNLITDRLKKPIRVSGVAVGFDYWKPLEETMWGVIGEKLAEGSQPSIGQLFFCDALMDIGAANLAQAVVALGVACELEVYSLVVDVRGNKEGADALNKLERQNFARNLNYLGNLNRNTFRRFDASSARLVNSLYEMRGAAAHRGHLPFVDLSKTWVANAAELIQYVRAAERLFDWLEIQRSKLV
jgi:hypothetical protein